LNGTHQLLAYADDMNLLGDNIGNTITFLGVPSIAAIFLIVFYFIFCYVPTTCFGLDGPSSSGIYTSQSLEAIMPTTRTTDLL
jgi:hypothetical protein